MIPLLQLYQIFFLKPVCYQGFGDVWDPVSTWTVRTKNGTLIETTLRQPTFFICTHEWRALDIYTPREIVTTPTGLQT